MCTVRLPLVRCLRRAFHHLLFLFWIETHWPELCSADAPGASVRLIVLAGTASGVFTVPVDSSRARKHWQSVIIFSGPSEDITSTLQVPCRCQSLRETLRLCPVVRFSLRPKAVPLLVAYAKKQTNSKPHCSPDEWLLLSVELKFS